MTVARFIIATSVASLALNACAGSATTTNDQSTTPDTVGITAASQTPLALTLDDLEGHPVDIARYRGRAVLIVAFFMDDLPSQGELRHAERLARELGDDIAVLAISGDRQPYRTHREMAQIFVRVNELQRTTVLLADDTIREGTSSLGAIEAVPTTFLVNRAGVLARRVVGYQDYPQLRALVAPAIPPRH